MTDLKTDHQLRVDQFMKLAGQDVPETPVLPSASVRLLRARLILEEALETVSALGFDARPHGENLNESGVYFEPNGKEDLVEIVDGCCDVSVVTIGTLSACGVSSVFVQREVDENNLAKFGPGHRVDEFGKLIKPPGHKKPDLASILEYLKRLG